MSRWTSLAVLIILFAGACAPPKKKAELPRRVHPEDRAAAARKYLERSQSKSTPRHRAAEWQLRSARLFLDSGEREKAFPVLQKVAANDKAAPRTRARALWLYHSRSDSKDPENYWSIVERFPDTVAAEDALVRAMLLEKKPASLVIRRCLELYRKNRRSFLASLILLECAKLAWIQPGERWKKYAISLLDVLQKSHPDSPRRDEALWMAANYSREARDLPRAIRFLEQLLNTRESSYIFGEYNSQWLDDAQLMLGDLHMEQNQEKKAIRAWTDLERLFPHSRLRDRAQLRLLHLHRDRGNSTAACAAARKLLKDHPRSRFAGEARNQLANCKVAP